MAHSVLAWTALDLAGVVGARKSPLRTFHDRRLARLVRHAARSVPFYRELYQQAGLRPEQIRGLRDLDRIPIVLRDSMECLKPKELIAEGSRVDRLVHRRTSGSSGNPHSIFRSWAEERLLNAIRLKCLRLYGMRLTDLRTYSTTGSGTPGASWSPFNPSFSIPRRAPIDSFLPARVLLDHLRELRPDVISCYPGTLDWLCSEATEDDRRLIRPRFILTESETLTPVMRQRISTCLNAPIYDCYGAHEFNLIAHECPQTGLYHVAETGVLVEVLKNGRPVRPGESGELVGTALHSLAMPLIRYRLGDLVTLGPLGCPCGAPCQTIERIDGRDCEYFQLPGGGWIHSYHLGIPLTRETPWVRRFQVAQEAVDHFVVRLVPMPGRAPGPTEVEALRSRLLKATGPEVRLSIQLVEQLEASASGKVRPYVTLAPDKMAASA
jgi:phenylacetate-CoA ligase